MNANKKSLGHIFDPSLRMVVPLFQRPYVWKQDENWTPLWESIQDVTERRLAGNPRPHFMGAIVLDQMRVSAGDIDTRQIIDGQQRMTSFQLLLTAARDCCKTAGNAPLYKMFDKLTKNDVPFNEDGDEVFKIWPTNADRNHFRSVLLAGSPEKVRSEFKLAEKSFNSAHTNLIPLAYLFFHATLSKWLGPSSEPAFTERLKVLWQSIKDDMQVVVIDLDEKDDAQVIFETLNALGTPLLPADLIKNFLFQAPDLKTENVEGIYEKYWKPFDQESSFWREEVRQGRLKRPRIDLFLQHYLTLMKGDEVSATHLFAEFRDLARKKPDITTKEHLQSIRSYGAIFQTFMSGFSDDSPEGRFFYRLNELDTTTVFPVLLEVFQRAGGTPSDEVRSVLRDLESFLVRRMVCGLTTKGYNTLMRTLIQKLRSNDTFSAQAVRDFLLAQDAESTRWPGDEEFEKAWLNRPLYSQLTQARVRILLEAIELEMYTGKSEKITIHSKLTIEHVLPQKWEEHWPLPKELPVDDAAKRRDVLLHSMGNLTLVTDKLNPALSNGPWTEKRAALAEHCLLTMNHKITTFSVWNESAIGIRAKDLLEHAKKIWPRPKSLGENQQGKQVQATKALTHVPTPSVMVDEDEENDDDADTEKPGRDCTQYDLGINGVTHEGLSKRKSVLTIVKHLCEQGVTPEEIVSANPWRWGLFCSVSGKVSSAEFIANKKAESGSFSARSCFCDDSELIYCNGKTYAVTKAWGKRTFEVIQNILAKFPDKGVTCVKHPEKTSSSGEPTTKCEWHESKVEPSAPHFKLFVGEWDESTLPFALVGKDIEGTFLVEFLPRADIGAEEYMEMKNAVMKELNFFLVELGEKDPWAYAIYHCGTSSNVYSDVHWGYFEGPASVQ